MIPEKTLIFVGPSAAGKDTIIDRISAITGAEIISTSGQVRRLAKESGLIDPTRYDLQQFANSMRSQYGEDLFARLAVDECKSKKNKLLIVNGVRNPAEIDVFDEPIVIGVDATQETRFKRNIARQRHSDPMTWQDFLVCDSQEQGTMDGKSGQQNLQCLSRAEIIISNNSDSIDNLEYCVDLLVDELVTRGSITGVSKRIDIPTFEDYTQKRIVVMNGPHGAGKTTISKRISPTIGVEFIPEIGGKLRQEVSYNSLESSVDFDREVMRREILRDHQLLRSDDNKKYMVETWHTGNIAYAIQRSPSLIPIYLREYEKQLRKFSAMHLLINVDDQTFMERITENVTDDRKNELLMFYKKIIESTKSLYSRYNLPFEEFDNSGELSIAEMMVTRSVSLYIS